MSEPTVPDSCGKGTSVMNSGGGQESVAVHPEILIDFFCQQCGYNLRGLTSNRCPECGDSLDSIRSDVSRLPWTRRGEIGWFRAYWRTVWAAMFRQKQFCEEMIRPVSYSDAQRFRWVTILHAFLPVAVAGVVMYVFMRPEVDEQNVAEELFWSVWSPIVLHVAFFLFLVAATGVPSYFFHPKAIPVELQNRAVAMSYYASAGLAWTFIPAIAALASVPLFERKELLAGVLILFAVLVPLGQLAAWWLDVIHIASRTMRQLPKRVLGIAVLVPILWIGLAGLILLGIPLLVVYVAIVFASLS